MASGVSRRLFWAIASTVVAMDLATKLIVVRTLRNHVPISVIGDWVNFQLVYNPGAAFGIRVGDYSRIVFTVLALLALVVLGAMVRQTDPMHRVRLTALALVCGGAVGNLVDRLRSARGVVDFIDVGIGTLRWPTFNVADMAVTCGAVTLAIVLWSEGREVEERQRATATSSEDKGTAPASS